MRTHVLAALAALPLLAVTPVRSAPPGPLTERERTTLVRDLEGSRERFLKSIEGLTEAQWNFKPGPERWSIALVAEHLTLVDQGIVGMVKGPLLAAPEVEPVAGDSVERGLKSFYLDRSKKFQAPEGMVPSGQFASQAALLTAYNAARGATLEYVKTSQDPIRWHRMDHPLGKLDGYQWLTILTPHSDRHLMQIEEVKKAPGYPRP
jgi:hypothetical protein